MNAKVENTMRTIGEIALAALTVRSINKIPKMNISPAAKCLLGGLVLIDQRAGDVIKDKIKETIGKKTIHE